jgi:vacuolar-type H+-ATPase subunit H
MDKEKELWGKKFRIAKNGLEEADVISYVESLKAADGSQGPGSDFATKLEQIESQIGSLNEQLSHLASTLDSLKSLQLSPGELADGEGGPTSEQAGSPLSSLAVKIDALAARLGQMESLTDLAESNGLSFDPEKLKHLDSLTKLAERTVMAAEEEAENVREEIEEKASENARQIVAEAEDEAKSQAQRIISEAEQEAHNVASQAQELLARSRQLVEGEIKGMFDQAYQRLLSNFQGTAGEQMDTGYQSATLESHEFQSPDQDSPDRAEEGQESDDAEQMEGSASELDEQPSSGETDGDGAAQAASPEENPASGQGSEEPSMSQEAEAEVESQDAEAEVESQDAPDEGEANAEPQAEASSTYEGNGSSEDSSLYDGAVELAIPPPVGLDQVMQLHKDLKQTPHLEVMNFGGSVDRGITIRLVAHSPTPLLDVIGSLPGVESAIDELQAEEHLVPSRPPGDGPPIRRIIVTARRG